MLTTRAGHEYVRAGSLRTGTLPRRRSLLGPRAFLGLMHAFGAGPTVAIAGLDPDVEMAILFPPDRPFATMSFASGPTITAICRPELQNGRSESTALNFRSEGT